MTLSAAIENESPKDAKLPRQDWILLPLLSLLTICLMVTSSQWMARRISPQSTSKLYGWILPK